MSAFAQDDIKSQLGQDKGDYSQCMQDTKDCTSGCDKKCAHLNPTQYYLDKNPGQSGKEKAGKANGVQN